MIPPSCTCKAPQGLCAFARRFPRLGLMGTLAGRELGGCSLSLELRGPKLSGTCPQAPARPRFPQPGGREPGAGSRERSLELALVSQSGSHLRWVAGRWPLYTRSVASMTLPGLRGFVRGDLHGGSSLSWHHVQIPHLVLTTTNHHLTLQVGAREATWLVQGGEAGKGHRGASDAGLRAQGLSQTLWAAGPLLVS